MEDAELVEEVAREFVTRQGADALRGLHEQVTEALMKRDLLSAEAWADIAAAAERLVLAVV